MNFDPLREIELEAIAIGSENLLDDAEDVFVERKLGGGGRARQHTADPLGLGSIKRTRAEWSGSEVPRQLAIQPALCPGRHGIFDNQVAVLEQALRRGGRLHGRLRQGG